ncbi:putative FBD-associated F-box protein At5g44940 [Vigna umbellata]|uniref:putative FBD-associated F-box protein At5g44940 n=1 Tax=Vigna umbellata TaxID=87088 RepID=UPI001F5FDB1B|nr:putative FBD-associated F-box protein At5g44940 [Vigna umbellata]
MTDRISSLPDEVLCQILSFLPTKISVSTSILSKRWKPLWFSVPAIDFYFPYNYLDKSLPTFSSMCTFILSRNSAQSIQRFRLTISHPKMLEHYQIESFITAALLLAHSVEHLDLDLNLHSPILISYNLLFCKTLRVLKLNHVTLTTPSSADLPLLKVLHLHSIHILEQSRNHLQQMLSACPNVEDLKVKDVLFGGYDVINEFKLLPNLVRAVIEKDTVPLKVVENVQFLSIQMKVSEGKTDVPIPVFHNLTHFELKSYYCCDLNPSIYWDDVFELVKHCPKLQNLSIDKGVQFFGVYPLSTFYDWPSRQCVPICISLTLRTCLLNNYTGNHWEFELAKYIMKNAKFLKDMIICYDAQKVKVATIERLSLCSRLSPTLSCCKPKWLVESVTMLSYKYLLASVFESSSSFLMTRSRSSATPFTVVPAIVVRVRMNKVRGRENGMEEREAMIKKLTYVMSTGLTFSAAFAFLSSERQNNFTWALERPKGSFMTSEDEPKVFVNDRDLALMNAIANVFPESYQMLCWLPILKNVKAKCKMLVNSTDAWDVLMEAWENMMQ